jgi:hypothetical protein
MEVFFLLERGAGRADLILIQSLSPTKKLTIKAKRGT